MKLTFSVLAGATFAAPQTEITEPAKCCERLMYTNWYNGGLRPICNKTISNQGRWFYDCPNSTAEDLLKYNPLAIIFDGVSWIVKARQTSSQWIEYGDLGGTVLDIQDGSDGSVCAADVQLKWGMFKCLDETAEHPSQDTTTSTTTPITTTAPQGHFSTRPVEACDEAGAYEMLIGKGKFTCETKTKKKGFRKICTVECNDGHKQGPRKVRCKNYDNRQGTAFKYWHTTHKQKKIICN